jgi:hypothetical protein
VVVANAHHRTTETDGKRSANRENPTGEKAVA